MDGSALLPRTKVNMQFWQILVSLSVLQLSLPCSSAWKRWNLVLKGPTWCRLIKHVQAHIPGGLLYNRIAFFIVSLIPGRTDPHHRGPLPCFAVIQLECIVYIHVFLLKTLKSIFWHLLFVNTIRQSGWEESGCNRAGINKFKTMHQQHTEHDVKTEL